MKSKTKKSTKAVKSSGLSVTVGSTFETFAPAKNKVMVLCGHESGPFVETEVAQHFRDALTKGKKSWTGTMWASGWISTGQGDYPSVFGPNGPHMLHPVYPTDMKKGDRRDVQFVRVTITPAKRRLSSNPKLTDQHGSV